MKGNTNESYKKIETIMLDKEHDQDEEDGGAIVAFNKDNIFKTLPVEEKGNIHYINTFHF
jgi:hypothetical protein